jgi:hypothetical protein
VANLEHVVHRGGGRHAFGGVPALERVPNNEAGQRCWPSGVRHFGVGAVRARRWNAGRAVTGAEVRVRSGAAVAAGAAEDDVVPGDRVPGSALDVVQGSLELLVGERLDLAAPVADQVVVMLAAGVDRLEA